MPHHQPCPPASSLSAGPRGGVIMLILKNVTAVQLHPAKVQEGVDIAIENDVIVA
ncbi:chlorohydrolase, partial [Shigella flexneri]|nr:chlorohydrolase [Shigella flexneri]